MIITSSGAVQGFEDIHAMEPYIEADISETNGVAHVYMIYVPPAQRGKGKAAAVFSEWLSTLPLTTTRIRLKAASCGGSDALKFWKSLGFTESFSGNIYHEVENTLVLGVNGWSNPVTECLSDDDDFREWLEGKEDRDHLANHPQTCI